MTARSGAPPPAGEDELIGWLRERLGPGNLLGDDAAVLPSFPAADGAAGARWVATVDSQVAGVHYPPGLDPALVARRLLAVNLSDLAATGADPAFALLALTAAPGHDHRRLLDSLAAACAEAGVTLAGGDLASLPASPGPDPAGGAVATLTLLGVVPGDGEPLRRSAARPGDSLWVAGALGLSAAGRHLLARGARVEPAPEAPRTPDPGRAAALWTWAPPPDLPSYLGEAARAALRRHLLPEP
ncbi:MAG TPA: AIR synthase related protein, partial [Thermoanaerobaculia bacterium]|nr:AIR synthase related protein [Thermoanaerobaculia bacterium]